MSNGKEKSKVLSTLSPDVEEFTPKHNQSLDVTKLGQSSNLSPDVPEFVPSNSKHPAGALGPHQVNLNTDHHHRVAGRNAWGGSVPLTEEERAVGSNVDEMPARPVAGRKSYKKEREHIASGEFLASRKKKEHFKTTSHGSGTTYRHHGTEMKRDSEIKLWRRENQNSDSEQDGSSGIIKNRTTAWSEHVTNDDKSLISQLSAGVTPGVLISKQKKKAGIKYYQSFDIHRQSDKTNLLSGESCCEGRQMYDAKGKTKGRNVAESDAKLDLESNSAVERDVKNPKGRNTTWKREKGSKEIDIQQMNDLNINLRARRCDNFAGKPAVVKGHQKNMKEQKEPVDLEPMHQTLDRRRTGEIAEMEVTNIKQNIRNTASKKRKKIESDSWFEEEMEICADQSFTQEKYSYQRDQLKTRTAEKDGWSLGDNLKEMGEAGIRLLRHQPVEAAPEFTNEDFPDIGAQFKAKKVSSDNGSSLLPLPSQRVPTVSYSAALRAAPRPKPRPAWQVKQGHTSVNEDHIQPGMLKLPGDVQFGTKEEEEKKKKKKKRKKKSKEQNGETGGAQAKQSSGKRAALPIQFDLGEILASAIKTAPKEKSSSTKVTVATGGLPKAVVTSSTDNKMKAKIPVGPVIGKQQKTPHNTLDSTAPVVKRGKERETPAKKKPSAMKKIILKEREERKKTREKQHDVSEEYNADDEETAKEPDECTPSATSCDLQTEAASAGDGEVSSLEKEVASQIHSRRFRDYCDQVLDKEVDELVSVFLKELVRFQDRQYHKDPVKAKAKRRLVMGIREVTKHLKLKKMKCLIISPNVERIKSQGGLDDALRGMTNLCHEYNTPVVFALKRQALGRVVCKKVPVSVVGIFNYDGAQEYFKKLMEMTEKARYKYTEMRRAVEQEIQERLREDLENVEQSHFEQGEETSTGQVRPEAAGGHGANTAGSS